jgi:RNA polymerase sigma-70 factor (ECF subfamily)
VKLFNQFYIEHKNSLFAYLMRMTGDYDLASDMLQESFTRLLARYPSSTWCKALLFRVARNAMIDEKRKLRDGKRQALTENHGALDHEHDLMIRESYREVLKALQDLDPMEQDILNLKISSNLTYRDIASIVGISEANVKVKIHRARIKLKSVLKNEA